MNAIRGDLLGKTLENSYETRKKRLESTRTDSVGTFDSEALYACFHVFLITMKLFFSIWEFRSQQISSSTENIYLLKTSVIFYDSTTCFGAWGKTQEEEVWEISGRALHRANKERFSCAFWLFWKYRKAMYWRRMAKMMWRSNGDDL